MEFNPTKASKAQISNMKKPEGLPDIMDNYQRPVLETYEKPEFKKSQKNKSVPEIKAPEIKTPEDTKIANDDNKSPHIKIPTEQVTPGSKVSKMLYFINKKKKKDFSAHNF